MRRLPPVRSTLRRLPQQQTRTVREVRRPCLACGAPWLIVQRRPVRWGLPGSWTILEELCSAACWRTPPDGWNTYRRGYTARRARGWTSRPLTCDETFLREVQGGVPPH